MTWSTESSGKKRRRSMRPSKMATNSTAANYYGLKAIYDLLSADRKRFSHIVSICRGPSLVLLPADP